MYVRDLLLIPAMMASLGACAIPPSDGAKTLAATATATASAPAIRSRGTEDMNLICGAASFTLLASDGNVRVESPQMTPVTLPAPRGMQGYVPVGMGCARSASGQQYLVVQYGEMPSGCKVCEWFFIYDERGMPMNEAVPPTRGYGETLEANNDAYERLLSEHALRHPSIEYPAFAPR
ncbi:hypothetical protein [Luteimonas sp. 100069]|uniref:hypothetical protein n=1 Tax=Luteimonas sp. 100069 TaxID=2006109 RepID=UPI000F4D2E5A|nr:hypothetical protein [Luteimonas sp. 100069]RPD85361.1 hypothetical protein EGK76_10695 [Luteimonas sp. 100069]